MAKGKGIKKAAQAFTKSADDIAKIRAEFTPPPSMSQSEMAAEVAQARFNKAAGVNAAPSAEAHAAKQAGLDSTFRTPDQMAEARRQRRLEIESDSNASPEARARTTAALDRQPTKNMTADEWKAQQAARRENSQAGKDYRQKQAELERQAQQQEYEAAASRKKDISQRKADVTDRRIARERKEMNAAQDADINRQVKEIEAEEASAAQAKQKADADMEKRLEQERKEAHNAKARELNKLDWDAGPTHEHPSVTKRKQDAYDQRKEDIIQRAHQSRKDKAYDSRTGTTAQQREKYYRDQENMLNTMSADEYHQHEAAVYDSLFKDTQKASNKEMRAARQARVDEVNKLNGVDMEKRTLGEKAKAYITGHGDESSLFGGRKTRQANMEKANAEINKANKAYIKTGEGSAQATYNKKTYWAEVKGGGKNAPDALGQKGMTAPNGSNAADVAQANAESGIDFSGIVKWAEDNPLIVAGGLVAGAVILTDD